MARARMSLHLMADPLDISIDDIMELPKIKLVTTP